MCPGPATGPVALSERTLSAFTAGVGKVRRVRLLVVEDEVRLAAALRRGLQAEGFTVDLAHDGVDGLHLARRGRTRPWCWT